MKAARKMVRPDTVVSWFIRFGTRFA
jgi:hypothetical protein